eukprot:CAMPEP_0202901240 /NCGR_PEP_ID=MMETSP1392-20130828/14141_1 /ASSEMBLY_ACC=CAM_ASM_000868 /TAXON_ID=225041 /ORGANISM="Chlamydomonas chlamydogama, Strain SAG 11-48b" /LENGTH=126 /DNA_ID=CAMNT_0049587775 /DNA_START=847 /DNA_END=1227 /DNA_ORIENTATION=+
MPEGRVAGLRQHVVHLNPSRMLLDQLVNVALPDDVVLLLVGQHQANLGLIIRILQDLVGDLQHGCYPSASSHHGELLPHVWGVGPACEGGQLEQQLITYLQLAYVLGHAAGMIGLNDELNVALSGG